MPCGQGCGRLPLENPQTCTGGLAVKVRGRGRPSLAPCFIDLTTQPPNHPHPTPAHPPAPSPAVLITACDVHAAHFQSAHIPLGVRVARLFQACVFFPFAALSIHPVVIISSPALIDYIIFCVFSNSFCTPGRASVHFRASQ